jgi:hypothetical protein
MMDVLHILQMHHCHQISQSLVVQTGGHFSTNRMALVTIRRCININISSIALALQTTTNTEP